MTRLLTFLIVTLVLAGGIVWVAERPGTVVFDWMGYRIETSLMLLAIAVLALIVVAILIWTIFRWVLHGPQAIGDFFRSRRQMRGLRALSAGMIAANSGDANAALRFSKQADKLLESEPLTLLLKAQAAQLGGNPVAAREAFEAMAEDAATETIGLRGLYIEAQKAGEDELAYGFAEQAAARSPALPWAANALLEHQTARKDWEATLAVVERNADNRLIDKKQAKRLRAVLLTAQAQDVFENDAPRSLELAQEAHKLAPELVPAAVIAAQHLASNGDTSKAIRIVEKTWKQAPHPDLAEIYAHARSGDSALDRLKRVRKLAQLKSASNEGEIAVARAALEAREFGAAREALSSLLGKDPSQRICLLMAEIENQESGDKGKAREWLARALRAPRDPAWTADGHVAEDWAPVSPVSGKLDVFEWKVPVTMLGGPVIPDVPDLSAAPDEPVTDAPMIEVSVEPAPQDLEAAESAKPATAESDSPNAEDETEVKAEPVETEPDDVIAVKPSEETVKTEAEAAGGGDGPAKETPFVPPVPDDPGIGEPANGEKRRRGVF